MRSLLSPLELAYRAVNRVRRALYRRGLLRPRSLPRPVVSIGNIALGGSGKTPTTIAIAEHLQRSGYRVAVLTRGHGRAGADAWAIVDARDARRFGDEPVLLAARLPECPIIVGRDRHRSGTAFLEQSDCDVFILDDGFQHLQLHRDLDIVIDDPTARWNREDRGALTDADILLVRASSVDAAPTSADPRFRAVLVPSGYRRGGERHPVSDLRGRSCIAMTALARNERFFEMLSAEGLIVVKTHGFPDHHDYSALDLAAIEKSRKETGAELILVTEKDAAKLPAEFDCAILEVEMKIVPEDPFYSLLSEELRHLAERTG